MRYGSGREPFLPTRIPLSNGALGELLKLLCGANTADRRRVVAISDNARYHDARMHRSWREKRAATFALD